MWKQHSKHIWSHLWEETLEENPNYWISFVWFIRIPSNSAPASFGTSSETGEIVVKFDEAVVRSETHCPDVSVCSMLPLHCCTLARFRYNQAGRVNGQPSVPYSCCPELLSHFSSKNNAQILNTKVEESANSWLELKPFWMHIKIWRYITKPCMQQLHNIPYIYTYYIILI